MFFKQMSRIGKTPIRVPSTVQFSTEEKHLTNLVKVTGKLGSLELEVPKALAINQTSLATGDTEIALQPTKDTKEYRQKWGLYRTLINNMIVGVESGYAKELEIQGIGYRAEMKGNACVFSVGLSHKITYEPPQGISLEVAEQVNVKIFGFDKQLVGEVAAKIRSFRKPEPYKGKGIRYKGEVVKKKSTKS